MLGRIVGNLFRAADRKPYAPMRLRWFALVAALLLAALALPAEATPCYKSSGNCQSPVTVSGKQSQTQQQAATATGGNANAQGGSGGAGGQGGNAQGGQGGAGGNSANTNTSESSATNGGNVQSSNTTENVQRSAPAIGLGIIAPNGCGAGVQGGGSNTKGAMLAGFAWTTDECYAFILAQSYQAIGQTQAACEILSTTNAAKRAAKRGVTLPACLPPAPVVVIQQMPGTYTQEQVDIIVKKMLRK
jgi:hypothetical protein